MDPTVRVKDNINPKIKEMVRLISLILSKRHRNESEDDVLKTMSSAFTMCNDYEAQVHMAKHPLTDNYTFFLEIPKSVINEYRSINELEEQQVLLNKEIERRKKLYV